MQLTTRFRLLALLSALPLAGLFTGCGASHARFAPTSDEARSSLEATLAAWRDGKAYGSVESKPPVQVSDSAWRAGQQVETFEINEEKDEGDATKVFTVTLKMKKPPGDQSARYYVHGRDPVWVYREDDYKRMINMDNNPEPASSSRSQRRNGRER